VIPEASYESTPEGIVPSSEGWFIVKAKEGKWFDGDFGAFTRFEGPNAVATPYRDGWLPG